MFHLISHWQIISNFVSPKRFWLDESSALIALNSVTVPYLHQSIQRCSVNIFSLFFFSFCVQFFSRLSRNGIHLCDNKCGRNTFDCTSMQRRIDWIMHVWLQPSITITTSKQYGTSGRCTWLGMGRMLGQYWIWIQIFTWIRWYRRTGTQFTRKNESAQ